jgi:lysophospholipase L1-like esterase
LRRQDEETTVTIVALGDSTTAGTPNFRSPLESPPHGEGDETSQYSYWLHRPHPAWKVLNRGIDGQRSDEIRARFQRDVLGEDADVVIIIAGVNDVYQGYSVEHVTEQLQAMYDAAAEHKVSVVAGSVLPFNTASPEQRTKIDQINLWIKRIASNRNIVTFCDTNRTVRSPQDPHMLKDSPDGLHPDPEGYRRMAEVLEPILRGLLARSSI